MLHSEGRRTSSDLWALRPDAADRVGRVRVRQALQGKARAMASDNPLDLAGMPRADFSRWTVYRRRTCHIRSPGEKRGRLVSPLQEHSGVLI